MYNSYFRQLILHSVDLPLATKTDSFRQPGFHVSVQSAICIKANLECLWHIKRHILIMNQFSERTRV